MACVLHTCSVWYVGKGAVPQWGLGEVLISQTLAVEPVGAWTTESVTHGQCDARPTVTFPAAERHRPLAGTKLYCLVTEAHCASVTKQYNLVLAKGWRRYLIADWPGVELVTFRSRANALTTEPPSHPPQRKTVISVSGACERASLCTGFDRKHSLVVSVYLWQLLKFQMKTYSIFTVSFFIGISDLLMADVCWVNCFFYKLIVPSINHNCPLAGGISYWPQNEWTVAMLIIGYSCDWHYVTLPYFLYVFN